MRLKIGLKSSAEQQNLVVNQQRHSELAIVHRRILSGPNVMVNSQYNQSDIGAASSFQSGVNNIAAQFSGQGTHFRSSAQIAVVNQDGLLLGKSDGKNNHFHK